MMHKLVYGSRQEEVAQGSDDDDEDQVDEIQLIPGKTFVMNPGLGECKFWIGKCKQLETKDGDRGMRVNFLELDDQDDEGDVQKELNGARTFAMDAKNTSFSDYDWVSNRTVWMQAKTAKVGSSKYNPKWRINANNRSSIMCNPWYFLAIKHKAHTFDHRQDK